MEFTMKQLIVLAGMLAFAFVFAYVVSGFFARKARLAAASVLPFVTKNFDALANKDGLITSRTLHLAEKKFTGDADAITFLKDHIGEFGHVIGHDDEAKAAAMMATAVTYPGVTPLMAVADFNIYGISRDDLAGTITISVSHWGTVKVTRG
jgi:hypothetical protein